MINLVYTEASLELIPLEIKNHPAVRRNAKRRGKPPEETLLDRSLHHWAMKNLKNNEKRGRPDIIHFLLVDALGSPLNRQGKMRVWVHTYQDYSIFVNPDIRPPKDFNRFKSLMEQLLVNGRISLRQDSLLLELMPLNAHKLLDLINPDIVIALSNVGEYKNFESIAFELCKYDNPAILIGAFPHGSLEHERKYPVSKIFSVYPEPLEAWTVNSRLIYEFEKHLGIYNSK